MIARRATGLVGMTAVVLVAARAASDEPCAQECRSIVACEATVVDCLIESGKARDAIARLKPLVGDNPLKPAFARLLARAYLAENNAFWAQRTLEQSIKENPEDCENRSWLTWVYIGQGDLDLARELMLEPGCPNSKAGKTRWRVLESYIARAKADQEEARVAWKALSRAKEAYPEDKEVWAHFLKKENPGWIVPLSTRLELLGGYSSNARAGSPTDTSKQGSSSALGRIDMFGRLVLPVSRNIRPALEGDVRGHGLTAKDARELSYLDLSIRPGVILGNDLPRVLFAYKGNLLLMNLDDKERYYEAHRGEAELETRFGLLIFAGAGRRIFREAGRTRSEFDGGLGASVSVHELVLLMFAVTGRSYRAVADPYDQAGGTGLAAARVSFGPGFYGRLGATLALDYYLSSGGELGRTAFGIDEKRFDTLVKQFEELWSPSLHGVRFGLRYEFSWRNSNADIGETNYDYMEHRALAGLRFSFDVNPWAPKIVESQEHVELDWGIEKRSGKALDEDRIQELLRQDEATRAGSSCVD
ncbi:MAG: hypothetical protein GY847_07790 [Proteobacteria bacterium]|nr:hypothetical protein [Pseudomonadota bacterium]